MNKLGIGMNMSDIKLPRMLMYAYYNTDIAIEDNQQINASSIFSYLNIRGLGRKATTSAVVRRFNALSYLSYWDIYKNYYANKQEEEGVVIHVSATDAVDYGIAGAQVDTGNGWKNCFSPAS